MAVFRFKQFSVKSENSSMKVNTDGVLLGAAALLSGDEQSILDAGTGTGTIALMLAQRCPSARITGIDIDGPSAEEAAFNFAASPWSHRLEALHADLSAYIPPRPIDLVVSNPPWFDTTLPAKDPRRSAARHTGTLSYAALIRFSSVHLSGSGRLCMILPSSDERAVLRCGRAEGLFPVRLLRIRTVPRKAPSRIIVDLGRGRGACTEEELVIMDGTPSGGYTGEYTALTRDFYLL